MAGMLSGIPAFPLNTGLPMTIKFDSIKSNTAKERDGDYIDIPEWPGVKLGVRSLELPAYKIAVDQLVQRYARRYKGKNAPPDVRDSDLGKLLAEHILFDWSGFDQEYSAEFALDMMGSSEGRELVKQVIWAAAQVAEIEVEFVNDTAKN
jgi:hypothetical protein